MTQTEFDFSTHKNDNNPESTQTLTINKKSFQGQNKLLFELLMDGRKLSFHDAYTIYGISDIRRRAKDLTDIGGFKISKGFMAVSRCKIWYMNDEDIKYNKALLISFY